MDIDITCPTCGELDYVQSVPALCADGVMASFETSPYTGLGLSSAGFVQVTGIVAAAGGRRRINKRITRGRGLARPVWQAGFYCHRCGTGFWPYSPTPGIPARQSLAPQHFRWHVWQAGGYRKY